MEIETSYLQNSLTTGFLAIPVTFFVVFDLRDTAKNDLRLTPFREARPVTNPIGLFVLRLISGETAAIVAQDALAPERLSEERRMPVIQSRLDGTERLLTANPTYRPQR